MPSLGTVIIRTASRYQLLQGLLQPQEAASPVAMLFQGSLFLVIEQKEVQRYSHFGLKQDPWESYLPHSIDARPRLVEALFGLHHSSVSPSVQFCFAPPLHRCWVLINMLSQTLQFWRAQPMIFYVMSNGWVPKLFGINKWPPKRSGRGKPYYVG